MKQLLLSLVFLNLIISVSAQVDLSEGLVAHYSFSGNAQDVSTFSNHGVLDGPVLTTDRFGNSDSAYEFDGIDDIIRIPDAPQLYLSENFTISSWVRPDEIKTQDILLKGPAVNGENAAPYGLSLSGTNDYIFSARPNATLVQARDGFYPINEWFLITGVKEGNIYTLYLNGAFYAQETAVGTLVDEDANLQIGSRLQLESNTVKGAIDEVRIYDRALSLEEIETLYNEEAPQYSVAGTIQFDSEGDNCSSGNSSEMGGVLVQAEGSTGIFATTTQEDGSYILFLAEPGEYTVSIVEASVPANIVVPTGEMITLENATPVIVDYCLEVGDEVSDFLVVAYPLNDAQPGFEAIYEVVIFNQGTFAQSGELNLGYDDDRLDFTMASPSQDSQEEGSLNFTIDEIAPFEAVYYTLEFTVLPPPVNEQGEILIFSATATPEIEDDFPDDNSTTLEQILVNSQDPNDKMAVQGAFIEESEVGDFLEYRIRFQNEGSANAQFVIIEDMLSDNLNENTVRVISASHDYRLEIENGSSLSFIFEDIQLPPVDVDEEGSQGYIVFQVRSDEDLIIGDSIENTASIFFDFNAPIITNTVVTTVSEPLGIEDISLSTIGIYPNPVSTTLYLDNNQNRNVETLTVTDMLGKKILVIKNQESIDVTSLKSGLYFLRINSNESTTIKKFIKN